MPEHMQAALISGNTAHHWSEPPHGLNVVGHHIGTTEQHNVHQIVASLEVGKEYFYLCGAQLPHGLHSLPPMLGAHIGKIVAVDRCQHHIFQVHLLHRLGHALRLIAIERKRAPARRVAEAAMPGADVSANHQCGCTQSPAFGPVGAESALADGVQSVGMDDPRGILALPVGTEINLQPVGFHHVGLAPEQHTQQSFGGQPADDVVQVEPLQGLFHRLARESYIAQTGQQFLVEVAGEEIVTEDIDVADMVVLDFHAGLKGTHARKTMFLRELEERLFAVDEVFCGKRRLQSSDFGHHVLRDGDGLVATHRLPERCLQFLQRHRGIAADVSHVLSDTLHALALQLCLVGRDDLLQHTEVGVDKQRIVHHAALACAVECGSRDLLAVEKNIVAARDVHRHADAVKSVGGQVHTVGKHLLDVWLAADKRKHDVALIGVDTATSALPARDKDIVLAAIVDVHFVAKQLIAPENHSGLSLPDKEIVVVVKMSGCISLNGKVESDRWQGGLLR